MIRDIMEMTVSLLRTREEEAVQERARGIAEERILDLLLPKAGDGHLRGDEEAGVPSVEIVTPATTANTREKLRSMLRKGKLDDRS